VISDRGACSETAIADLQVWRVGRATYSCALSRVKHNGQLTPGQVRDWLSIHEEIVHSTIETQRCPSPRRAASSPRAPLPDQWQ
jgi:hypothetical protein